MSGLRIMEFMLSILIRLNFFSACVCELANRIILENTNTVSPRLMLFKMLIISSFACKFATFLTTPKILRVVLLCFHELEVGHYLQQCSFKHNVLVSNN